MGEHFQSRLRAIVEKHNIKMVVGGLPCISTFSFQYENPLEIKTLFIQEMLKQGYLTTVAFYVTNSHNIPIIDKYLETIESFFLKYKEDIENNDVIKHLNGPICHGGFQRVN